MTLAIADVLGCPDEDLVGDVLKNLIFSSLKKQLAARIAKSVIKVIPFIGWAVGPTMSVAMLEATGWQVALMIDGTYHVSSYQRQDGTYVSSYRRSK